MVFRVMVVLPPILARKTHDTLALEYIFRFGYCCQSHRTLVCNFAGKHTVVWIWIQLTGMAAPYSRETSAGMTLSDRGVSASHSRVKRREPVMTQLTVSPAMISEEARHAGPRTYRRSSKCSPVPPTSSMISKHQSTNSTVLWCWTPILK